MHWWIKSEWILYVNSTLFYWCTQYYTCHLAVCTDAYSTGWSLSEFINTVALFKLKFSYSKRQNGEIYKLDFSYVVQARFCCLKYHNYWHFLQLKTRLSCTCAYSWPYALSVIKPEAKNLLIYEYFTNDLKSSCVHSLV